MRSISFSIVLLLFVSLLSFHTDSFGQAKEDKIVGVWLVQKKDGKVEVYKKGDTYFGKIVWMHDPNDSDGKPKTDKNNPEAAKRSTPIQNLTVLSGLKWNGKDKWENGNIYDPASGKTYSASVKLKDDNTLEFTGYVGFSFIGRTETWTRTK
jgi:uncharacterized protein (DUF2147 family)